MKSPDWKTVAELIGIAAIVASLIFVGLQLKQSQDIAIAAQYQARAANLNEMSAALLQSERNLRLRGEAFHSGTWRKFVTPDVVAIFDGMSPEDLGAKWYEFLLVITIAENNHYQYQAGFLDEEAWEGVKFRLGTFLENPIDFRFYQLSKPSFRPDFQAAVDEIIAETRLEPR